MLTVLDTKGNILTQVEAKNGENLFTKLTDAGYNINASCGGKGTCKKCKVNIDGSDILSCKYTINGDHKVIVPDYAVKPVISFVLTETGNGSEQMCISRKEGTNIGVAVDIGTTTIAAYYYDMDTKRCIHIKSGLNPQRKYGADVISRIDYTIKNEDGTYKLQKSIIDYLKELFSEYKNIKTAVIAGNTTMLHFLAGEETKTLAASPYTPKFVESRIYKKDELGLNVSEVILLPSISAFIGADITAGILSTEMYLSSKKILLIDMGTNGEMVLSCQGSLVASSTACGPAFEGANIKYGMGGASGAICKVYYNENDELITETLGNEKAIGICGSGLIDIIACLVQKEIIDETGYMDEDYELAPGIFITPKDVREFQNAKAAIMAGIKTMIKHAGLKLSDIDEVLLAGGFGSYIDINNAINATLLPKEFRGKCRAVGNSSGAGACSVLIDKLKLETAEKISSNVNYIELAESKYFSDFFVESMIFEE